MVTFISIKIFILLMELLSKLLEVALLVSVEGEHLLRYLLQVKRFFFLVREIPIKQFVVEAIGVLASCGFREKPLKKSLLSLCFLVALKFVFRNASLNQILLQLLHLV